MGVFDRDYMRTSRPGPGVPSSWKWRLIILCAAVWFVQRAAWGWFRTDVDPVFGLSLQGLSSGRVWQLLTYAFLHADLQHLFWNAFGIYVFGGVLESELTRGEMVRLTLWSAITGGAGFLLGQVVMGRPGIVIGASGFVSAYLALAALRHPSMPFRLLLLPIGIPLWVIAVVYLATNVSGALSPVGSGIAYWAHLGGAAYGAFAYRFGVVPTLRSLGLPRLRLRRPDRPRERDPDRLGKPTRSERRSADEKARVDALLDKISAEGIGALTDEERAFLNDAAGRYR